MRVLHFQAVDFFQTLKFPQKVENTKAIPVRNLFLVRRRKTRSMETIRRRILARAA